MLYSRFFNIRTVILMHQSQTKLLIYSLFWLIFFIITGGSDYVNEADSDFHYKTNRVNLLFGHWFAPVQRLHVHPYLGLNISDLRDRQATDYLGLQGSSQNVFCRTAFLNHRYWPYYRR